MACRSPALERATASWMGFAVLALALGGCSCGDTVGRPADAAGDAIRLDATLPQDAMRADACRTCDAGLDVRDLGPLVDATDDADAFDSSFLDANVADGDAADAETVDLGADLGVDSGCEAGLEACVDESGTSRCVDLRADNCHCGRCNHVCDCVEGNGLCADCGGASCIRCRPPVCSPDGPQPVLVYGSSDHDHCGECWHACADDERCESSIRLRVSPVPKATRLPEISRRAPRVHDRAGISGRAGRRSRRCSSCRPGSSDRTRRPRGSTPCRSRSR